MVIHKAYTKSASCIWLASECSPKYVSVYVVNHALPPVAYKRCTLDKQMRTSSGNKNAIIADSLTSINIKQL